MCGFQTVKIQKIHSILCFSQVLLLITRTRKKNPRKTILRLLEKTKPTSSAYSNPSYPQKSLLNPNFQNSPLSSSSSSHAIGVITNPIPRCLLFPQNGLSLLQLFLFFQ
jgi:hypothetical protein